MGINWNYPTTMWIGENRIEDLSLACKELDISNPLFVTDKDLINLDLIKNIILRLKKSFKNLATFSPIGFPVKLEKIVRFLKLFFKLNIIFFTISKLIKSLSVTNNGFEIPNSLQAKDKSSILSSPIHIVVG